MLSRTCLVIFIVGCVAISISADESDVDFFERRPLEAGTGPVLLTILENCDSQPTSTGSAEEYGLVHFVSATGTDEVMPPSGVFS